MYEQRTGVLRRQALEFMLQSFRDYVVGEAREELLLEDYGEGPEADRVPVGLRG